MRIRHICDKHTNIRKVKAEFVASDLNAPYNIGKTQNHPIHIPQFLLQHVGDPATKVGWFILILNLQPELWCHDRVL